MSEAQAELDAATAERKALNEEHDQFVADMKERKVANKERLIAAEQAVLAAQPAADPELTQSVEG